MTNTKLNMLRKARDNEFMAQAETATLFITGFDEKSKEEQDAIKAIIARDLRLYNACNPLAFENGIPAEGTTVPMLQALRQGR